jgi:hypothetical protein
VKERKIGIVFCKSEKMRKFLVKLENILTNRKNWNDFSAKNEKFCKREKLGKFFGKKEKKCGIFLQK